MAKSRLLVIVVFLSILTVSCATPPGKLTESDFVSKEIVLDIPVSKAHKQLLEGLRYCGSDDGTFFLPAHFGVPDCMPAQEDGAVLCDLYIHGPYGGRSYMVLGRIELKPNGEGTTAALKVIDWVHKKDKTLNAWEQFIRGKAKEVCPK